MDYTLYRQWYGYDHGYPDIIKKFVYGMPELHRECGSCGMSYEISSINAGTVEIKPAENVGEDWGE